MKKIALLLFFFISVYGFSQFGNISGNVKFEDGNVTIGALIKFKEIKQNTITDTNGNFDINIPYGNHTVEISSIEAKKQTVLITVNTSKVVKNIILQKSDYTDIEQVVIDVKSEKNKIETKGFAVNVVETQKIALQSIQTNEILDRSAGVRIRQDGGLGSRINYNINGMSGSSVKIFINGVPASNYGSSFSLNSIPPSLIERIEVYKGVVPAYLSDDALGGAINIILKQKVRNSLTTSYSYGSFNTHQWNMTGSYIKENGFTMDVSAFQNYSDNDYKVWGQNIAFKDYTGATYPNQTARRFHDAYRSYGINFNLGFTDVKWADKFLIGGVFSEDYKEIQHGITMNKVYGDRHNRRNANVATLLYNKRNLFTEGLSLKLDASYSYLKRQVVDSVGIMYDWSGPIRYPDGSFVRYNSGSEVGDRKTTEMNSDKVLSTRVNVGYEINDNNIFYINYLFNGFTRGITDDFLPVGLKELQNTKDLQKNILSFTYENIAFSQKLRTNIFYKHYFQKITSHDPYREDIAPGVPNYKVNSTTKNIDYSGYGFTFSYQLLPKLYILGSAEKTIRLPGPDELFGNTTINLLPPVNNQLDPEISYNANLGVNLGTFDLGNNHLVKLNTSVFYRDTRGMIREAISSGSFEFSRYENLENVLGKGIDAEFVYEYSDKLNFTFNISKFESLFNTKYNEHGAPYLFYRTQIRNEPSFKYNVNLTYYHKDLLLKNSRAAFYYNVHYVEEFLRNWANVGARNLDVIPTQFSNDIGFAYTFPSKQITFSFDAKNIFNKQLFDNFGLQKPGRAFYGKIIYNIL